MRYLSYFRKLLNKKLIVPLLVCLLIVGYATVSTILTMNGGIGIAQTNFDVHFNRVILNGANRTNLFNSDKTSFKLTYSELSSLDESLLEYEIVNNSDQYDADVSVSCSSAIKDGTVFTYGSEDSKIPETIRVEAGKIVPSSLKIKLDTIETPGTSENLGTLYNMVKSKTNGSSASSKLDYTKTPLETGDSGVYETNSTDSGKTVYFYRGVNENNNVVFGNKCWLAVRTTETNGVKLIYNGNPVNGTCLHFGTVFTFKLALSHNLWSTKLYDNAYVGYMYGKPGSESYEETHANINDSEVKEKIDEWYEENLLGTEYEDYLEDTVWCNDRSIATNVNNIIDYNPLATNLGYGGNLTFYATAERASNYSKVPNPSLKCKNVNDRFTVDEANGNGALKYKVATITADEAAFAGIGTGSRKDDAQAVYSSFISPGGAPMFTMTPSKYYDLVSVYSFKSGRLLSSSGDPYISGYVVPMISVNSDILILQGDGSQENPYMLETEDVNSNTYTCKITVTPVSRDSYGKFDMDQLEVGDEYCIGKECFYIISRNDNVLRLFAKYNLYVGRNYTDEKNYTTISKSDPLYGKQNVKAVGYTFNMEYPYYAVTDYSTVSAAYADSIAEQYVDEYVAYLKNTYKNKNILSGSLITKEELEALGCDSDQMTCNTSWYDWITGRTYWVGSYNSKNNRTYVVGADGFFGPTVYTANGNRGIRPVITYVIDDSSKSEYYPSGYKERILNGTDPVLADGLIPVNIAADGTVIAADTNMAWYNYEKKKWANAVILNSDVDISPGDEIKEKYIESYFVWIPRYKYKIFDEGKYTSHSGTSFPANSNTKEIQIVFENKYTTPSKGTIKDSWLTHPAFTNFDTNGIWVGKFETGYEGAASKDYAQVNEINSSKVVIKPNVYSWRNSTASKMFHTAYDYKRDMDSHMLKNTEWGAIAYLSHSQYGINTEININNNSDCLTGYSAVEGTDQNNYPNTNGTDASVTLPYNTATGYKASTTGNITGIYDISGGSWEVVAGHIPVTGDNSGFTADELTKYSKYFDVYPTNNTATSWDNRILGDATGEMGPYYYYADKDGGSRYHSSWYKDNSGLITTSSNWFRRGGFYQYGHLAGAFSFATLKGGRDNIITSRIALIPEDSNPAPEEKDLFEDYYTLAASKLKTLSLEEKVGQLILAHHKMDDPMDAINNYHVSGFTYFGDSFKNKTEESITSTISNEQSAAKIPLITAVDEEGGAVVRVALNTSLVSGEMSKYPNLFATNEYKQNSWKSSSALFASGGYELIEQETVVKSSVLKRLGLNVNFAPVVDMAIEGAYISNRVIGLDVNGTAEYAKTVIRASKDSGVSYTLKHFPGYGNNSDTHSSSSVDTKTKEELMANDVYPFKTGIAEGAEVVMVAHNIVAAIDSNNPASLSKGIHDLLTDELNYTGIIATDALDMGATAEIENKFIKAVQAGNHLLLVQDYVSAHNELVSAVNNGILTEQEIDNLVLRVLAWKYYKGLMRGE